MAEVGVVHVIGHGEFEGGYLDGLRGSGGKRPDRFPNSVVLEKVTYKHIRGRRSFRGPSAPGFRSGLLCLVSATVSYAKESHSSEDSSKVPIGVEGESELEVSFGVDRAFRWKEGNDRAWKVERHVGRFASSSGGGDESR